MKSIISKVRMFIACACFFVGSSAFAQMEIENIDLTGFVVPGGTCTGGEAWFTSGQWQIMSQVKEDGNGGWHYIFREQIKGGVIEDSNGDTYRVSGNSHEFGPFTSEQHSSGGNTIIHDSWNLRYTPTKGSDAEAFWLKGRLHIVIDSEGTWNVINNQIETGCV
ncbi:MAG: hypothetical protein ACI9IA_000485 [Enterobacterales bacterium]|jgi:hypothetical protein